jgi:hypothetical protein
MPVVAVGRKTGVICSRRGDEGGYAWGMERLNPSDPKYVQGAKVLRRVGPAILLVGLIFAITAVVNLFTADGRPTLFWMGFVGLPLMFVGGVMCQFGFMGSVARYVASQGAPVAADTFNYMADETRDGVKTVASAVAEGVRDGMRGEKVCAKCGIRNDHDSRFCKGCGVAIAQGV